MAFRNLFPKKVTTLSREHDIGGEQHQQQHQIRSPRLPFSFPVKNPFSKSSPGSEASESGSTGSGSGSSGSSGGGEGGGGGGFLKKKGGRHQRESSVDKNAATIAVVAAAGNGGGGGVGDGGTTDALATRNLVSSQPAVATARAAASSAAGGRKLGGPATAADRSAALRQTDAATPNLVMLRSNSDNPKAIGRDNGAMARSSSDAGEPGMPIEASAAKAGGGAAGEVQTAVATAAAAAAAAASPASVPKAPPKLMLFDIHEPIPSSLMAPPPSSGRGPVSQPAESPVDSTPGSTGGGFSGRHRSLGSSSSFSNSPGGLAAEGGATAAATPGGGAASAKPKAKAKLRKFKEKELRAATEGFAAGRELGEGSFGKVYSGRITMAGESGVVQTVAVKVLNEESSQGMEEMLNEVLVAKGTTHPNLIRLLGYSIDTRDAMLVYEFCPNGSVESRLQPGEHPRPKDFPWEHRVRAMLQTAQALNCLHENNIIHRDLKLANLLLDEKDDVKLSDFGMAKELGNGKTHISTRIMGTMGYLDPNYVESGKLREKSDVFSFGVIMLELLSGRKAMDPEDGFLFSALQPVLHKRPIDLNALLDPGLEGKYNKSAATKVAKVAKMCTSEQLDSRPELRYVIADLESALSMSMGGSSRK